MNKNHTEVEVAKIPKCNLCQEQKAKYDARIPTGQWGFLCENCFRKYGCSLGLGKGQKLVLLKDKNER